MSARLTFQGLAELRAALRALPTELADEGGRIVTSRAEEAAQDIASQYPEVTGNLKAGVRVVQTQSQFGAKSIVKSTAKHAVIFENGSQARRTSIGANRGSMPPGHVFVPTVIRKRRAMQEDLIRLLERAGLETRGAS